MSQSIATRTGDKGTTGLLYDKRVPKIHLQVEACGCIDELSACISIARAQCQNSRQADDLLLIQQDLVALMAELALDPADWARYAQSSMSKMDIARLERLDLHVVQLEASGIVFLDWNLTHITTASATLDYARTLCRRAERRYWALESIWHEEKLLLGQYLNRLADVLWLMAREKTST